jgi:hypothetical protein
VSERIAFEHAAERAAQLKAFLGWDLARFRAIEGINREGLAARLQVDSENLMRLELCRSPQRGSGFRADVETIAQYVGIEPLRLAATIRLGDVLATLQAAPQSIPEAVLAAARDAAGELSLVDDLPPAGTLYQPTWLHRALETFWMGETNDRFPRDLELEAITRLSLAIVELEDLRTDGIEHWLDEHESPLSMHAAPRPLRAALVAYGGVGVIFIDALLDENERLISLAHELGHFLSDYLLPREEVERTAPRLVDVIDGLRPPTRDDEITALLSRTPLGVHTHLLGRTARGEYGSPETERAEERATRIAWELLAPQQAVAEAAGDLTNEFLVVRTLQSQFRLPGEAARAYARYLAEALGGGDESLDRRFRFDS